MKSLSLREKADFLRHLGHPTRLAILEELLKGEKCVSDLHSLLNPTPPNLSLHLAVLRQLHIVDYLEEQGSRCYFLTRPALARTLFSFISENYPVEPHRTMLTEAIG